MNRIIDVCLITIVTVVSMCPVSVFSDSPRSAEDLTTNDLIKEHHRVKRKIIEFDYNGYTMWRSEIPFYFARQSFSKLEKNFIRDVLKEDFEANTCLIFTEHKTAPTDQQFIHFRSDGLPWACQSTVGMKNNTLPSVGQGIYLHDSCYKMRGHVIFAIAATLGLHGEITRPDRDDFIDIMMDNVNPNTRYRFRTLTTNQSMTLGVPYDYGSISHISSKDYGTGVVLELASPNFTVVPKDLRFIRSIGQRSELSFYDIEILNKAYCKHKAQECPDLKCANGGYPALNCSKCLCPDGFAGQNCEDVDLGSSLCTPSSGTIKLSDGSDMQCLRSPYYGLPNIEYDQGDSCTWLLQAPEGRHIDAWFTEDIFALPSRGVGYTPCLHWVEIKYQGREATRGPRYCDLFSTASDSDLLSPPVESSPITSLQNEMMIIFKAPDFSTPHFISASIARRGFQLCFKLSDAKEPPSTTLVLPSNTTQRPSAVAEAISDNKMKSNIKYFAVAGALFVIVVLSLVFVFCYLCRYKKKKCSNAETPVNEAYENPEYAVHFETGGEGTVVDIKEEEIKIGSEVVYTETEYEHFDDPPPKYEDIANKDS